MNRPAPTITTAKAPTFAAVVKRPANFASVDAKRRRSNGRGPETCYKRSMGRPEVARDSASRALSVLVGLTLTAVLLGASGCAGTPNRHAPESATHTQVTVTFASETGEVFGFPDSTQSPLGLAEVPATLRPFFAQCKLGDAALARVAERFARRQ